MRKAIVPFGRNAKVREHDLSLLIFLHTCLVLSPTYNLAVKSNKGKLTKSEMKYLPNDFDNVLKTYERFNDPSRYYALYWIETFGADAMQGTFSMPTVRVVCDIPSKRKLTVETDGADWVSFLNRLNFSIEEKSDRLLVVIPKSISRSLLVNKILMIAKDHGISNQKRKSVVLDPKIMKRVHIKHLSKLETLYLKKINNPNMENWRLGAITNFSPKLSEGIDVNGGRYASTDLERINRELLGKVVGRALAKYERIIENAARGVFPSDQTIAPTIFDKNQMKKIWDKHNKYIDRVSSRQSNILLRRTIKELSGH